MFCAFVLVFAVPAQKAPGLTNETGTANGTHITAAEELSTSLLKRGRENALKT